MLLVVFVVHTAMQAYQSFEPPAWQMTLFHVFLKADADRSSSIGASIEEANAFVDIAMGKRTMCARRHA